MQVQSSSSTSNTSLLSEISGNLPITVKVNCNGEIRRMPFQASTNAYANNWSSLRSKIVQLFNIVESSNIVYKYEDEENELINISSEEEFLMALSINEQRNDQPTLRIKVIDASLVINHNKVDFQFKNIKKIPIEERKGFEENLCVLKEFGFTDERFNIKVMRKFYFSEEDFHLVVDHLCERSKKAQNKINRKQRLASKREERKKIKEERKRKREEKQKDRQVRQQEYYLNKKIKQDKIAKQDKEELEEKEEYNNNNHHHHKIHNNNKKERFALHEDITTLNWEEINEIYLDGNNMLFICSFLRDLVLKRRKKGYSKNNNNVVEQLLGQIAKEFGKAKMLKKVVMIYDSTKLQIEDNESGFEYILCSARPEYTTSDDRLVEWAKENGEDNNNNHCSIYVTSDRELCKRLKETGVRLISPKRWLFYAVNTLSGQQHEIKTDVELDLWLHEKLQSLDL